MPVIAIPLCAGGGFLLGSFNAPDAAASRDELAAGRAVAVRSAQPAAARQARTIGSLRGKRLGRRAGGRAGNDDGRERGVKAAENLATELEAQQQLQQEQATADRAAELRAQGVPPGLGPLGCGGDPYAAYGPDGCIAAAHPPTGPAQPEDCPAGQVPVGITGACAPPE